MGINSRQKGARGEREWRDILRAEGFDARRGQQFSGGPDSPDVICDGIPLHWEVKRVEALNMKLATEQAQRDAAGRPWAVAHKRNHAGWFVTVPAETFFKVLRDGMEGLCPR